MKKLFPLIISIIFSASCVTNNSDSWELIGPVTPYSLVEVSSYTQGKTIVEKQFSSYLLWCKTIDGIPHYQLRSHNGENIYAITKNPNYGIQGQKGEKFTHECNLGSTKVYLSL